MNWQHNKLFFNKVREIFGATYVKKAWQIAIVKQFGKLETPQLTNVLTLLCYNHTEHQLRESQSWELSILLYSAGRSATLSYLQGQDRRAEVWKLNWPSKRGLSNIADQNFDSPWAAWLTQECRDIYALLSTLHKMALFNLLIGLTLFLHFQSIPDTKNRF